jgi:hypothetical protein
MQEPANIPRSNTNCKSTQFPDVSTALPDSRQVRISARHDVKALVAVFFPAGQEPQFWEKNDYFCFTAHRGCCTIHLVEVLGAIP